MFDFLRRKTAENVLPTFSERLQRLESRQTRLEADILDLATAINIMRDKVLRKIQFKKEEEEPKAKDIYAGMLIPETNGIPKEYR